MFAVSNTSSGSGVFVWLIMFCYCKSSSVDNSCSRVRLRLRQCLYQPALQFDARKEKVWTATRVEADGKKSYLMFPLNGLKESDRQLRIFNRALVSHFTHLQDA